LLALSVMSRKSVITDYTNTDHFYRDEMNIEK